MRKDADDSTFTGLVNISAWGADDGGLVDERLALISMGKGMKIVEQGRPTQTNEVILQLVVLSLRA